MLSKKSDTLKFYEQIIKDSDHLSLKLKELRDYAANSFSFWKEYENPTYTILEVYPKSKNGTTTQKPYYRAQTSFTNNGKKERISCYIGPIADFQNGKSDYKLITLVINKLKEQMIAKSQIPSKNEILENNQDRYLRDNYKIYQLIRRYLYSEDRPKPRQTKLEEGLFKKD
jgi:hypothetical protein